MASAQNSMFRFSMPLSTSCVQAKGITITRSTWRANGPERAHFLPQN